MGSLTVPTSLIKVDLASLGITSILIVVNTSGQNQPLPHPFLSHPSYYHKALMMLSPNIILLKYLIELHKSLRFITKEKFKTREKSLVTKNTEGASQIFIRSILGMITRSSSMVVELSGRFQTKPEETSGSANFVGSTREPPSDLGDSIDSDYGMQTIGGRDWQFGGTMPRWGSDSLSMDAWIDPYVTLYTSTPTTSPRRLSRRCPHRRPSDLPDFVTDSDSRTKF
jgi:hypothetical protein